MTAPKDLDALIEAGSDRLGDCFLIDANRPEKPPWFDQERFNAGRELFRLHALSISFSYLCSLYVGFTVNSLAESVSFTGESGTPDRSRRRYLSTMGHLYAWHVFDVINDQSSIGYRSIRYVRGWHDKVRKRLASTNGHPIDHYINQYDTATVQIGFVAPIVLYPRQFGVACGEDRLANYVYFWRVIGYVLGLDDGVNACGADLDTTKKIAKEVEQRIILPGLSNPSDNFLHLSETLVDGLKPLLPHLNGRIIRAYVYPLMGLPVPTDLSWTDYFVVKLLKLHFLLMYWMPFYASYWNKKAFRMIAHLASRGNEEPEVQEDDIS